MSQHSELCRFLRTLGQKPSGKIWGLNKEEQEASLIDSRYVFFAVTGAKNVMEGQ